MKLLLRSITDLGFFYFLKNNHKNTAPPKSLGRAALFVSHETRGAHGLLRGIFHDTTEEDLIHGSAVVIEADEVAAVDVEQALAFMGSGQDDLANAVSVPIEGVQNVLTRAAHGEIDVALVRAHALGGVARELGALVGGDVLQVGVQHMQGLTTLADCVRIGNGVVGNGARALFNVHVLDEFQGIGVDQGEDLALLLAVGDYQQVLFGIVGHIVGVTQL